MTNDLQLEDLNISSSRSVDGLIVWPVVFVDLFSDRVIFWYLSDDIGAVYSLPLLTKLHKIVELLQMKLFLLPDIYSNQFNWLYKVFRRCHDWTEKHEFTVTLIFDPKT